MTLHRGQNGSSRGRWRGGARLGASGSGHGRTRVGGSAVVQVVVMAVGVLGIVVVGGVVGMFGVGVEILVVVVEVGYVAELVGGVLVLRNGGGGLLHSAE